jgi:hypothetical protein
VIYVSEELDTCISGSIASPNEKAMVPRALKALKDLDAELPCKLYFTDVLSIFFPKRCCKQKKIKVTINRVLRHWLITSHEHTVVNGNPDGCTGKSNCAKSAECINPSQ